MLKNFKIQQMLKNFKIKNVLDLNEFGFFKKTTKSSNDSQTSPANYIKVFANITPVEFVSDAVEQKDLVIATAYKQVFGNVHLMESERVLEAESQLRSGQITVMEFIRQLAKSERYRALVFEKNSNLRAIELNFKHLLGRTPESYTEVSEHIARLADEGFDAEIDSYIDKDEYFEVFGTNIVPYYRGYQTQTGRSLAGYTHSFQLLQGASSSDKSTPTSSYKKLDERLLDSRSNETPQPLMDRGDRTSYDALPMPESTDPVEIIRKALNLDYRAPQHRAPQPRYGFKSYDASPIPDLTDPVEIIRKALKLSDVEKS